MRSRRWTWLAVPLVAGCFGDPAPGDSSPAGSTGSTGPTTTSAGTEVATSPGSDGSGPTTSGGAAETTTSGPTSTSAATDDTGPLGCQCPYDVGDRAGHCLDDGRCVRFVFATSQTYLGTFGSTVAANTLCQDAANLAGLPGYEYRAFVAMGGELAFAVDNVGLDLPFDGVFATPGVPPVVVATGTEQFRVNMGATLDAPLGRDEHGATLDPSQSPCGAPTAWTGMEFDAAGVQSVAPDCAGWTNAGGAGSVGRLDVIDPRWAGAACNGACGLDQAHLLCFEVPPP